VKQLSGQGSYKKKKKKKKAITTTTLKNQPQANKAIKLDNDSFLYELWHLKLQFRSFPTFSQQPNSKKQKFTTKFKTL